MPCRERGSQPWELRGEDSPEKHLDLWVYIRVRWVREMYICELELEDRGVMFVVDQLIQGLIRFSPLESFKANRPKVGDEIRINFLGILQVRW